ncbi:PH domain-containing protein [Arenimonas sp.]|uniref:PH domain-containing protein n=1 Tax=Arenimonas sp. TaxID=1872635 RepID=UPI0039E4000C
MSSEPSAAGQAPAPDQRLHPLSWLFVLIGQLKQFALPLIVLLFTGRRSDSDLYALIGVGVLVLISIAQYFTYRYRIDSEGVTIRSGVFQRNLRHIPFARIQNVSLHQSLLHRFFGVAEVRLESAGAAKPEGQMRVLRLDQAHEFERLIRQRSAAAADGAAMPTAHAATTLLQLPTSEVIRLGLIDNRGMLVVGGGFALLAQAGDNLVGKLFESLFRWFTGQAETWHLGMISIAAAVLFLLLCVVVLLRLLSVLLALLQFHGFRLEEEDGRLRVERGLLTRWRGSAPRRRIQAFHLREGMLHRWFGRQSLRVDTAVGAAVDKNASLRDLVPIAEPARLDVIVDGLLPAQAWPVRDWQQLHARAWWRQFAPAAIVCLLATGFLCFFRGPWALLVLALLPLLLLRAKLWAKHSAYSVGNGLIAFRSGWLDRNWRFAEIDKLQAVEWMQSPFDRRHGMASLRFDTIGANPFSPALRLPYLPEAQAREIYRRISERLR